MKRNNLGLVALLVVGVLAFNSLDLGSYFEGPPEPVTPDWTAIAAWPGAVADEVEATPDPNRVFTAIVLDDSGSMGNDIEPAKRAVIEALNAMAPSDRVAVIALNDGLILPFMSVEDAAKELPAPLARVTADGSTPLTGAMQTARLTLEAEAARSGGFGTYRILVTTDGAADDGTSLEAEIENLAQVTPIQVATIGVGIGERHVLSRGDLGSFVSISDISGLAAALQSAIAEEQSFTAITDFGGN